MLKHYRATVLGAGPAGLATVATLLDKHCFPVLWIDPEFNAGRLSRYVEVPSNTKVETFQQFPLASPALRAIAEPALRVFQGCDPNKGCKLSLAVQMVRELTEGIRNNYGNMVHFKTGKVEQLQRVEESWVVDGDITSSRIYLATGSKPRVGAPPPGSPEVPKLDLDDVLTPSRLASLVGPEDKVAVIGSSHSAVLALMHLHGLERSPRQVVNVYKNPLKYAESRLGWTDWALSEYTAAQEPLWAKNGWLKWDNTGLKGEAAEWARKWIETGELESRGWLRRLKIPPTAREYGDLAPGLLQCTKVVYATGFTPNPLPEVRTRKEGEHMPPWNLRRLYTGTWGTFHGIPEMQGMGIAFPESRTDPEGVTEKAVGLWKFMQFAQKTVQPGPQELRMSSEWSFHPDHGTPLPKPPPSSKPAKPSSKPAKPAAPAAHAASSGAVPEADGGAAAVPEATAAAPEAPAAEEAKAATAA